MAIGNHITLVRSVPNIPWYNALGILQNLNPAILQSMANTPANQWAEKGLLIPFKVKQIAKHNVGARPLATVGFTNWSAQGITVDSSNIINRQGAVVNGPQYQTAQANVVGTVNAIGCFFQSVFWTVNVFMDDTTHDLYVGMSRDYANPWTDLTIRQLRVDTGAEANLSFNNATREPNNGNRSVGDSSVGTAFQPIDIFYGGILFNACSFDFELSCKLFKNYNSLKEYQTTGNDEGEIGVEKTSPPTKDRTTILYMNTVEYKSEFSIRKPSEIVGYRQVKFYVRSTTETGDKIKYINRAVVGFCQNNSASYRNLHFLKNDAFEIYKIETRYAKSGAWTDVTKTFDWSTYFTVYKENSFYNGYYYWSTIDTNMYIFDSLISAQKGIQGLLDGLIDGGFGVSDTVETTLTDNIVNYDCGMSETWILDEESARKLATQFNMELNNNNTNIIGDVIIGLSMYQNPIDVVVDFFDIPIEIDDFYESEYDSFSFGINVNEILPPNNDSNIS